MKETSTSTNGNSALKVNNKTTLSTIDFSVLTIIGYSCKLILGYSCNLIAICKVPGGNNMDSLAAKITDSELTVMRVLWEAECELSITDIRKTLEQKSIWDTSTIKTLLRRLCEKGVVLAAKREVFYYKPLVSETEYNEYSTHSLIDRLFAGSARKLVASLLESKKLNRSDIEDLRNMFKVGGNDE